MALGVFSKLSYGIGHVLNDLCASLWFSYALVFYNYVVQFSSINSGAIVLVGQIADAVSTPIVGILSDRGTNSFILKYGKRKTWHLIGTICVVITTPFMYSPCIGCEKSWEWVKLIYYCIFVAIFQFGWAAVQISHLSLVPDLTSDENERTSLLSIRYSFTVLANLAVYLITWSFLETRKNSSESQLSSDDMLTFQEIAYVVVGIGAITSIIFHISVKECSEESLLGDEETQEPRRRMPLKQLFSKFSLYQVGCIYMATRLFCNICQSLIPLYLHDVLQLQAQSLAIIPFVMFVSSFLTSLITQPLNAFSGRKISFLLGGIIGIGASVWVRFGEGDDYKTYIIYAIAILYGAATSILLVTSLSITADLIGEDVGNGALIYGLMSLTDKLSNGAAIMVIQALKPNEQSLYYQYALSYVCGASAIFGVLCVITLSRVLHSNIQSTPANSEANINSSCDNRSDILE